MDTFYADLRPPSSQRTAMMPAALSTLSARSENVITPVLVQSTGAPSIYRFLEELMPFHPPGLGALKELNYYVPARVFEVFWRMD